MNPKDIYVRLVDPTGKHSDLISYHRVWDEERFMAALQRDHMRPDNEDQRLVHKATQADYRKATGYKPQYCN